MRERPALRYHGGKFRIRKWIIERFPAHSSYIEPFGGAASVLLSKAPAIAETYNDVDHQVVNFFRVLREPKTCRQLARALRFTPYSREEFNNAYAETSDPVESARRLVVRSYQGLGANAIQNRTRSGWRCETGKNLDRGKAREWVALPDLMERLCERLRAVQIDCRPWQELFSIYDHPAALWYVDPPYPHSTRTDCHRSVYRYELTNAEHEELLAKLLEAKGYVVLSSYPNPMYDSILEGWRRDTCAARAQTNSARVEALYLSPRTVQALQPRLMEEA